MTSRSTPTADLWPRIRDTFVAPGRLAARLEVSAPWLDVLLITTAVAVLGVLALPDEIFTESMREAVTRRGQPVEITSPPEEIARWGRAIAMLATLATHPMIAFVLAGLLTLVFSIVGGGRGTYREFLSLSAHGLLIPALGSGVAFVARLLTAAITGGEPFGAFLGPDDTDNLLLATITGLDPFTLWMMVVIGIGVSEIDRRFPWWRAAIILVGGYLLMVLATTYLLYERL